MVIMAEPLHRVQSLHLKYVE